MCDLNEIYTEKIEDTPTVLTELYKLKKKVDELIESQGYGTIIKDDGTPIASVELNNSPAPNSNSLVKSGGIYSALALKQDKLTFDNTPTEDSDNPVKSGGVYSALSGKQDTLTFDNTPTENSDNPVKSGGVYSALAGKQDTLTFDDTPTEDSDNPVKSGGVYSALSGKQDTLTFDNIPSENSNNPVKSDGIYKFSFLDLLWKNANAFDTSAFNPQSVTIDNSKGYEMFLILFAPTYTTNRVHSGIALIEVGGGLLSYVTTDSDGVVGRSRTYTISISDNFVSFNFGHGYVAKGSTAESQNEYACKPYKIFGIHAKTTI